MHISEGVLAAPVLAAGVAVTAAGVAVGLKKMDYDKIPQVAVLTSAFFVASLIHVPIGPASVHLVLNGLLGLLLGWAAFPAILVGLALQAVLFQFGGLTTLGVNTLNMAIPAILCYGLLGRGIAQRGTSASMGLAFTCGFLSVLLSSVLVALCLICTGEPFFAAAKVLVLAHLPVMLMEGVITAFCLAFLKRVRPELLGVVHATG
jgi:cobalt/nickel transport system permease protein